MQINSSITCNSSFFLIAEEGALYNSSLGLVPDYSDDPHGLRITGVKPGSPAEKAGLTADDIVTKVGPTQIKNIYDLMSALGSFKPGDTTDVSVLRDGKTVTVKVTFAGK